MNSQKREIGIMDYSINTFQKNSLIRSTIFDVKNEKIDEIRESQITTPPLPLDHDSVADPRKLNDVDRASAISSALDNFKFKKCSVMVNMKENVGREDRCGNISSKLPNIDINPKTGKVNPININLH